MNNPNFPKQNRKLSKCLPGSLKLKIFADAPNFNSSLK